MTRNILFTVRYHGGAFHGSQVQKNALTVTDAFQDAVERVFGSRLPVKGCSRTDSGVHANRYCFSMLCDSVIPCDKMVLALNVNLPPAIAVTGCCEVPLEFHARYSCVGKQYRYRIRNSAVRDPFFEGLELLHRYPLDVALLNRAAQDFVGEHDFRAFCSVKCDPDDTVRRIYEASVTREGEIVWFTVTGDGFLYNMVRIMVGTLLKIAESKIPLDGIPAILKSQARSLAGTTAPACGLYLWEVYYDLPGLPALPESLCPGGRLS